MLSVLPDVVYQKYLSPLFSSQSYLKINKRGVYKQGHPPPVQCTQDPPYIPHSPPLHQTLTSSEGPVIHNQRTPMGSVAAMWLSEWNWLHFWQCLTLSAWPELEAVPFSSKLLSLVFLLHCRYSESNKCVTAIICYKLTILFC